MLRAGLATDGSWRSYLVTGWLSAAVLYRAGWYHESAQIQVALGERVPGMSAADVAWLAAALRRAGMSQHDWVVKVALEQLSATQRRDGGWPSDDGLAFDVHTTLAAIRAVRQEPPEPPPVERVGRHAAP